LKEKSRGVIKKLV